MKIPFKPIEIEDRDIITSFTIPSNYKNCDYSFANICSWRFLYDSEFAIVNGSLLIRFWIENKTRVAYMTPTGQGYLREDLATLKGKKYQAKRNHINKFNKKFAYEYIPITPELVPECLQLECKWYKANREDNDEEDLNDERRSIIYALNHYDELGLIGGAICVDHQIVAFTFGAPINHNTFGVHVEKANVNYEGAYAVINKEFASHLPEKYTYVNREEDLGIPGLRQAKLSYNPFILLEKSAAIKKPAK